MVEMSLYTFLFKQYLTVCNRKESELINAIIQGQPADVIELLLKHNALVRHCSSEGNALDVALAHNRHELLAMLRFAYVFEPP